MSRGGPVPGWSSQQQQRASAYRGTSLIRKRIPLGPYRRPTPRILGGVLGEWAFFYGQKCPCMCLAPSVKAISLCGRHVGDHGTDDPQIGVDQITSQWPRSYQPNLFFFFLFIAKWRTPNRCRPNRWSAVKVVPAKFFLLSLYCKLATPKSASTKSLVSGQGRSSQTCSSSFSLLQTGDP